MQKQDKVEKVIELGSKFWNHRLLQDKRCQQVIVNYWLFWKLSKTKVNS